MDHDDEGSRFSTVRDRSRRLFIQSVGVAGVGLITGTTVAASNEDDDGNDDQADESTAAETTEIDSCTVIDEPGEYELVADITFDELDQQERARRARGCLVIASDGVTVRGNDHTIEGNGTGSCIVVGDPSRDEFLDPVIEDVVVRGADIGVSSLFAGVSEYTNVTAVENGSGFVFFGTGGSLTNCHVENNRRDGIFLQGEEAVFLMGPHVDLDHCTIKSNGNFGLRVGHLSRAEVSRSRIVENGIGVETSPIAEGTTLEDCHICRNEHYGVDAGSQPGDDPDLLDDPDRDFPFEHRRKGLVVAVDNYWGAADGPSSFGDPEEPFTDPETGRPANGDGDAISQGLDPGVSNVRFDPFRESTLDGVGADR